jgi:hypothetical protein
MAGTALQRADGRWRKGQSGNPAGRPAGRPNRSQAYLRELLAGDAEGVIRAVVRAATAGDMVAAKLILDRILPRRSCRPLDGLVLPSITTVADAVAAINVVMNATLRGAVSAGEAGEICGVIEICRRSVETAELAARIERLEQRASTDR